MATTFKSADGSTRCAGCHLHLDTCTCRPGHPLWRLVAVLLRPREV